MKFGNDDEPFSGQMKNRNNNKYQRNKKTDEDNNFLSNDDETNDIEEYKASYMKSSKRVTVKFENDLKDKEQDILKLENLLKNSIKSVDPYKIDFNQLV